MGLIVNYHDLNSNNPLDEYLPLFAHTVMGYLARTKSFKEFVFRAGFNNLGIRPGGEPKTASKPLFGLFA